MCDTVTIKSTDGFAFVTSSHKLVVIGCLMKIYTDLVFYQFFTGDEGQAFCSLLL